MTRNYGNQMLLQYRQELPSLAHRNSRPVHRANVPRQRRTEDVSHGQKNEQHGCRAKMRKSTHCRRAGQLRPVTADGGQVSRRKGSPTAASNVQAEASFSWLHRQRLLQQSLMTWAWSLHPTVKGDTNSHNVPYDLQICTVAQVWIQAVISK